MYVAVKGGERAIERSWDLLAEKRRGDRAVAELTVAQIREQLRLAVARVMTEGSVYDEELAALAIKQAAGDLVEAIFLLRAYRTTLPRFGYTLPIDTEAMHAERRISAAFKDIPGGQMLGGTYDYTQRLLDFTLLAEGGTGAGDEDTAPATHAEPMPRVLAMLDREGLIEQERGCRISPAATKAFCCPSAMRRSAATRTVIRSRARSATGKSRSNSNSTNWALRSRSATSR
jgi:alpha-D-ribose 1-methylphosphonate 5-triphosphate synthase subunit PhnI